MVLLGKTYGNWMVDLRASNVKLKARSIRIVSSIAKVDEQRAADLLEQCHGEVKTAIVSAMRSLDYAEARSLLEKSAGKLRAALTL
jgi:N-acetylmuramic acid 6-phosphate etherase